MTKTPTHSRDVPSRNGAQPSDAGEVGRTGLSALTRREFCARTMGAAAAGLAGAALARLEAATAVEDARPQRPWEIFVIQHSHIDIGYTDRQEVIADYHRQFVRQAVEMATAAKQRERSPEARFRYTIEGFWSLEQFLAGSSAQQQRALVRALKSGMIELTAGYFHLTELLDEALLRSTLEPAQRFARRHGLSLPVLMGCDINGFSWGYADLLADLGVRYLSMNINVHHGGALGKPLTPFYWESPRGQRLLVWNGLAYHRGNVMGLMGYMAPDTDLGVPGLDLPPKHRYEAIRDISMAERKLLPTLAHLEKTGYPYGFLPLMGNAVYTDNGPAGDQYCELIAEWNRAHGAQVRIRTATLREFFAHIERTVSDIPVLRGDWTDWWSDGVAATPLDTMIFRNAQRTRHLVRMLDPREQAVSRERLEQVDRKLALYAEHTFGYSHTNSTSLLTHQVFLRKTMHAVQADELAGQALVDVLRRRGEGEFAASRPFTYRVVNPLDQPIRTVVALPTDYWEQSALAEGLRVVGAHGEVYPSQVEPVPRGQAVLVKVELAARREVVLRVEPGPQHSPREDVRANGFENRFYRASWDRERGWHSWVEASTGKELLEPAQTGLGGPVYQLFPGGDRGAAAGFGYRPRRIPKDEVSFGRCVDVRRIRSGDVLERWAFEYAVPGTTRYVVQATFYRELPQIGLVAQAIKTEVTDPEGLYVAFPFSSKRGTWHFDKAGGLMRPGLDQLPGACCDYYCLQTGAVLADADVGVAWTTLDAPLVHLGRLKLWHYSTQIEPVGPLFSWLTNNKWETNFRLSCGGRYEFRYELLASGALADPKAGLAACRAATYPPVVLRG